MRARPRRPWWRRPSRRPYRRSWRSHWSRRVPCKSSRLPTSAPSRRHDDPHAAFAVEALHAGHRVVGTVRRSEDATTYKALDETNAIAKIVDMADEKAVATMVGEVERAYGPIDVLIANAGYGHEGLFEESSMNELRRQFEVNVFGTVALIKAVLPGMRVRRHGHILAITSIGGLTT